MGIILHKKTKVLVILIMAIIAFIMLSANSKIFAVIRKSTCGQLMQQSGVLLYGR